MTITTGDYPTIESVVQGALRFYQQHMMRNGVPQSTAVQATSKGGDRWATVMAFATPLAQVLANNRNKEDASSPDSAVGDDLVAWAKIYGIARSPGAGASGNVTITSSGIVTYAAGQEAVATSNGKRYRVVSLSTVPSGSDVGIVGIDIGPTTNLDPGEILTWTSPPIGSATTCVVSSGGLTNGTAADNDAKLRTRLQKRLRNPQNGGSWSHVQRWLEDASASVQTAYIYPAAQGPGTNHAAYSIEGTTTNRFARAGTTALTTLLAQSLTAQAPEFSDALITTVVEQDMAIALRLTLPEPKSAGGNGGGWIDTTATRWPPPLAAGPVAISVVTSATTLTCTATTVPIDTAWIHLFDSANRKMVLARVVSHSGVSGAYVINLDRAVPTIVVGNHVSPASSRGDQYAELLLQWFALLAPGEKTSNAAVLPRAYRHPKSTEGYPSELTTELLSSLQVTFAELTNATMYFANTFAPTLPYAPTVPASVTSPPNVWRPKHVSFYP